MFRKSLAVLAGSAAIIVAAPAVAAPGGAHGGGPSANANVNAGMGSMGATHASPNSSLNRTMSPTTTGTTSYNPNSPAAQNSQALQHASPTAIAHANQNSVLARGALDATSPQLANLATGLNVQNSGGTMLGTVTNIIYGPNNTTIRAVVVTSATGQTYTLPANTLTVSGGVVTTTSTVVG